MEVLRYTLQFSLHFIFLFNAKEKREEEKEKKNIKFIVIIMDLWKLDGRFIGFIFIE